MDCCVQGHTLTPRHWMWSTALTSVGAMRAGDVGPRGSTAAAQTAETASAALDVLRDHVEQQGTLACTGCADDIDVTETLLRAQEHRALFAIVVVRS